MYSHPFSYHRAATLEEASKLVLQLGEEARLLAGGQSVIPLMKMRLARPTALVDINGSWFVALNATTANCDLARSSMLEWASKSRPPSNLHDCAAGIADVQVRNQGTIGARSRRPIRAAIGAPFSSLETSVRCAGSMSERTVPLEEFIKDAYTTVLTSELVRGDCQSSAKGQGEPSRSRGAPRFTTVRRGVQLILDAKNICRTRIVLGCVGLTALRAGEAEAAHAGSP